MTAPNCTHYFIQLIGGGTINDAKATNIRPLSRSTKRKAFDPPVIESKKRCTKHSDPPNARRQSNHEDNRREELAFMVDAILRTVNNLKENFHMYESATMAVLNIARAGIAQPPQVIGLISGVWLCA